MSGSATPLGRGPTLAERARHGLTKPLKLRRLGDYGREDAAFIRRLMAAGVDLPVAWDVGASDGSWSMIVAARFPDLAVELFEPLAAELPGYARQLRVLLAARPLWRLHVAALGARDGEATIFAEPHAYGSTLLDTAYARATWRPVTVPLRSGDALVAAGEARAPDLIKVDTQGFEAEVLRGCEGLLTRVKALLLETWLSRDYGPETPLLPELIETLAARGFVLAELSDGFRDPAGWQRSVDAFFVSREVAEAIGFRV